MHTGKKRIRAYTALLLAISTAAAIFASAGTSYARYSYTGENQVVLYTQQQQAIASNVLLPQGCTVLLNSWDVDSDCNAQTVESLFTGPAQQGVFGYSVPEEVKDYFTFSLTDSEDNQIIPGEIVPLYGSTVIKMTVTPIREKLITLTEGVELTVDVSFTEMVAAEDDTQGLGFVPGEVLTGTFQWDVTPSANPQLRPEVPGATVNRIENNDLTYAVNFKADTATEQQLEYYSSWYADFELKLNKDVTFNAGGTQDGWLAGQLDAWSSRWIKIPSEDVTIRAGQPFKVMEYASRILNGESRPYTYGEVYEGIKDFDCGVFFTDEYLMANPDLEVTLELRMYNPENPQESYVIGQTYIFKVEPPQKPTATAGVIEDKDLTFALNFKADTVGQEQLNWYSLWPADFELKLNKDVTFNAGGTQDGWLAGQLDAWSPRWIKIPSEDVTIPAGQPFKVMEYASRILNGESRPYTYGEVYEGIKDFDCGVFFTDEYLMANPDLEVTLELRMYNPENPQESYVIGQTYIFKVEPPQKPTATAGVIEDKDLTFALNFKADTVGEEQLNWYSLWPADFELKLNKDVTFNAGGTQDGWLAGQLDAWSPKWIKIPFEDVTVPAGQPFKVMEYASRILNGESRPYTYGEVYEGIKDFDCGVFFTDEYLMANPDLQVSLELRMYNPYNQAESYVLGQTYTFSAQDVLADNTVADLPAAQGEEVQTDMQTTGLKMPLQIKNMVNGETETQQTPAPQPENTPAVDTQPTVSPQPEEGGALLPANTNMKNLAVINGRQLDVYTYINYSRDTQEIELNPDEGFAPFTQIHTEDGIYILPFGGSYKPAMTQGQAGEIALKTVTVYGQDAQMPESVNTTMVWKNTEGTEKTNKQQSYCVTLDNTDFASFAPMGKVVNARSKVEITTPSSPYTSATVGTGCVIEFFNGTEYVPAAENSFDIRLSGGKTRIILATGDIYPQAGVYRIGYMLQPKNGLSIQYKTFFVNYR